MIWRDRFSWDRKSSRAKPHTRGRVNFIKCDNGFA
jgi:hypothetical protein